MMTFRRSLLTSALFFAGLVLVPAARAASPAIDTADDTAYDDGWQTGDNGGVGWSQFWVFNIGSNTGAFIGSSPGIDTSGRSFGLYNDAIATAVLASRFLDGPLDAAQIFAVDIARDPAGGEPALWLTSGGNPRVRIEYSACNDQYQVVDANGTHAIGPVAPTQPVTVEIFPTGPDAYSAALTPFGGSTSIVSGPMMETGPITIVILRAGGTDATHREQFFNSLTVPEPSGAAGAWFAVVGLGFLARSKRHARGTPLRAGPSQVTWFTVWSAFIGRCLQRMLTEGFSRIEVTQDAYASYNEALDEEAVKLVMMTKDGGIEKNYYVNNEHGRVQVNAPWYGPVFQQMFSNVDWDALEMTARTEAADRSE